MVPSMLQPIDTWLLATTLLTGLLWVPYVLDRMVRLGIPRSLGNPQPGDWDQQSAWARRAHRAHLNAVEGLVVFAPLALLAGREAGDAAALAATAAATYFFARLAHAVVYVVGLPGLRTIAFLISFGAQLTLASVVFGMGAGR